MRVVMSIRFSFNGFPLTEAKVGPKTKLALVNRQGDALLSATVFAYTTYGLY